MAKNPILKKTKLAYRGSVKNVYELKAPTRRKAGRAIFEFTDDYSVFDYGKMPDKIPHKGRALALMTAAALELIENPKSWRELFRSSVWDSIKDSEVARKLKSSRTMKRLRSEGLRTHYLGMVDGGGRVKKLRDIDSPTNLLAVRSINVVPPNRTTLPNVTLWDYSKCLKFPCRLIPIECVFRFGAPKGSSFFERASDAGYRAKLGLTKKPRENSWFDRPVVEFFSKLEPSDRFLDYEFALNVSGLGGGFIELYELTVLGGLWLKHAFAKTGFSLWDGKFEFALIDGELTLVDAVTPDELRLTYKKVQMSKEPIRQYYKIHNPDFAAAMKDAKALSATDSRPLKKIVAELGHPPRRLDVEFKRAVSQMYLALAYRIAEPFGIKPTDEPHMNAVIDTFKKFKVA